MLIPAYIEEWRARSGWRPLADWRPPAAQATTPYPAFKTRRFSHVHPRGAVLSAACHRRRKPSEWAVRYGHLELAQRLAAADDAEVIVVPVGNGFVGCCKAMRWPCRLLSRRAIQPGVSSSDMSQGPECNIATYFWRRLWWRRKGSAGARRPGRRTIYRALRPLLWPLILGHNKIGHAIDR